jgi:hypothetical protein
MNLETEIKVEIGYVSDSNILKIIKCHLYIPNFIILAIYIIIFTVIIFDILKSGMKLINFNYKF